MISIELSFCPSSSFICYFFQFQSIRIIFVLFISVVVVVVVVVMIIAVVVYRRRKYYCKDEELNRILFFPHRYRPNTKYKKGEKN